MFLTSGKNIFCFRAAKFVAATYVSRAAKLGNICLCNNVSATMFPSLARPLNGWNEGALQSAYNAVKEGWEITQTEAH